jgi:hypothetical protein
MAITISGSGITSANIADGTIVNADVNDVAASKLTGALPAISAASLTSIPAGNLTGALPAISGASLTNLPGGGKVLQVVSGAWDSAASTTSTSWVSSSASLVITPSATTSKIVVCFSLPFRCVNSSAGINQGQVSIFRDGINLGTSNEGVYYTYSGEATAKSHSGSFTGQDSPATTSAVTYNIRIKSLNTSTTTMLGYMGKITGFVMEIGA